MEAVKRLRLSGIVFLGFFWSTTVLANFLAIWEARPRVSGNGADLRRAAGSLGGGRLLLAEIAERICLPQRARIAENYGVDGLSAADGTNLARLFATQLDSS